MSRLRAAMKRLARWSARNPGLALSGLASLTILATTFPLWGTVMNRAGDDIYHLANEMQVAMALERGQNPFGPLDILFGTPILKFYQPLFYLITGSLHALFGIHLVLLHNALTVLAYALSPFALRWSYRALGLSDLAAGLAAFATLGSVAAFGNSYEAYFQAGIVTQSLGAVFFPLFIGSFARLLRERRGLVGAAALFGLTFVSHVIMAVYAVLAGALLFLVGRFPLRRLFWKLAAFSTLCLVLVAFWLVPFLAHQERHRPIPDSVLRTGTTIWFVGLSPGEMNRQLFPGRLLDDAKVLHEDPQGPDDALTDRLNIMGTLTTRVPYVTVLVLLGFLLCLWRLHSLPHRFLATGFVFSLLLLLGPDDVPWLNWIPFSSRIQAFRCVYLMEFFAFGLAGVGLEIVANAGRCWIARRPQPRRRLLHGAGIAICVGALAFHWFQIGWLVHVHIDLRNMAAYELLLDVAREARAGFPLRTHDHYYRANKKRNAWMAYHRLRSICGHWTGLGPSIIRQVCNRFHSPENSLEIGRRMGVGYYLVGTKTDGRMRKLEEADGKNPFHLLKNGRGHWLNRDRRATFLWAADRTALAVCDDSQWFYLSRGWLTRSSSRGRNEPPVPVRMPADRRITAELLELMSSVWILSPDRLQEADLEALAAYSASGGALYSVEPLHGVESRPIPARGRSFLDELRGPVNEPQVRFRKIRARLGGPFEYEIEADRLRLVLLPELAASGWHAVLDGEPTSVFAAGPDLVAAIVPEGRHCLRFWWQTPTRELVLILASAAGWACVLAVIAVPWIRGLRRRRR